MAAAERAVRKAKRAEPVDGYQLRIRIVGNVLINVLINFIKLVFFDCVIKVIYLIEMF